LLKVCKGNDLTFCCSLAFLNYLVINFLYLSAYSLIFSIKMA